jgi:hypothetical protein
MVMVLPPMVPVSLAGGLAIGFCWADKVATAMRRPIQTRRRFIKVFLLRAEPWWRWTGSDGRIVAPCTPFREAAPMDLWRQLAICLL